MLHNITTYTAKSNPLQQLHSKKWVGLFSRVGLFQKITVAISLRSEIHPLLRFLHAILHVSNKFYTAAHNDTCLKCANIFANRTSTLLMQLDSTGLIATLIQLLRKCYSDLQLTDAVLKGFSNFTRCHTLARMLTNNNLFSIVHGKLAVTDTDQNLKRGTHFS